MACLALTLTLISGSIHDCWDADKLNRMNFQNRNDPNPDPGLNQFAKMVKCLTQQQGRDLGENSLNNQWNQFANFAQGAGQNQYNNNNNPYNNQNRDWNNRGGQPKPGVHPDDFDPRGIPMPGPVDNWNRRGPEALPPPSRPPTRDPMGGGDRGNWGKDREVRRRDREQRRRDREHEKQNRRKNQNNNNNNNNNMNNNNMNNKQSLPIDPMISMTDSPRLWNNNQPQPGGMGMDLQQGGTLDPLARDLPPLMNQEEAASRKYGYIIMAMSVIVLAVLMVVTIFCCNSSNSTMAQSAAAANAAQMAPVNQFDTYSIYSFKGDHATGTMSRPMLAADTLRSTGTLGGLYASETMKSRNSPQYRVSDIDPEYARRFKDSHY